MESTRTNSTFRKLIIAASIAIPLVVAILFRAKIEGFNTSFLPPFYAGINGLTAVLLIVALVFIKQKKIKQHELVMKICMVLSLLFLVCYVIYHMTSANTPYGGNLKMIYYPLLIAHILLSIAVVPMVLFSYLFAWENKIEKHRKLAKITWPIWFFVAVSGVVVYFMISPFYT